MRDFRDLNVWRKAHELTLLVYDISAGLPRSETYGLTAQMRGAAASIPANMAEGCGRSSQPDFARFCSIAMGSASELEYHLLLAKDLKLITLKEYEEASQKAVEVKRMLTGLLQKLRGQRKAECR